MPEPQIFPLSQFQPGNQRIASPWKSWRLNSLRKNTRFSPEVRQRAVRMVIEGQNDHDSQWAAISSIAPKIGCTPETLRIWLRQ